MGYPKYDKEEAQRVYQESVDNYNKDMANRHPAEKLDGQVNSLAIVVIIVLSLMVVITLLAKSKAKAKVEYHSEKVVVTKYRLRGGKSSTFIVSYFSLYSHDSGEWRTKEIDFAVGDTITIDVEKEIK